jgi:transposase
VRKPLPQHRLGGAYRCRVGLSFGCAEVVSFSEEERDEPALSLSLSRTWHAFRLVLAVARQLVDDELWAEIEPLLPKPHRKSRRGRPRTPDRLALTGIVFVLRTGIPWEDLPRELGCSGMTCWKRLRDWQRAGVWRRVHQRLLERLQRAGAIDWSRASVDSAHAPAKRGVQRPGPTPRTAENWARSIT